MSTIEDLIIDRVLKATLFDKATGEVILTIDQVKDAPLEVYEEDVFPTDADELITE